MEIVVEFFGYAINKLVANYAEACYQLNDIHLHGWIASLDALLAARGA